MSARREVIGQRRAQPARGKIREPAHVVQRLAGRPGGDDAVHAALINRQARQKRKANYPGRRIRRPGNGGGRAARFPFWQRVIPDEREEHGFWTARDLSAQWMLTVWFADDTITKPK